MKVLSQDKHNLYDSLLLLLSGLFNCCWINRGSQWCLLVTPVTVTLRDWKTCFFFLSIENPFISMFPPVSSPYIHFFSLNLHDSIFSYLWAKLIEVKKLIVQACVWLPDGKWMGIKVSSRITMTWFFWALEMEKRPWESAEHKGELEFHYGT